MSRLMTNSRTKPRAIEQARASCSARADDAQRDDEADRGADRPRRSTAASAAPATPRSNTSTSSAIATDVDHIDEHLQRERDVGAREPDEPAEQHVVRQRERRRPDADVEIDLGRARHLGARAHHAIDDAGERHLQHDQRERRSRRRPAARGTASRAPPRRRRAPSACAVSATVPMRRNANSQNRQSNTTDDIATAPSRCASPSRPITPVATTPSSGVVALDKRHRHRDREHARVRDDVAGFVRGSTRRSWGVGTSSARREQRQSICANGQVKREHDRDAADVQRGARRNRRISQIGITMMAPSRK